MNRSAILLMACLISCSVPAAGQDMPGQGIGHDSFRTLLLDRNEMKDIDSPLRPADPERKSGFLGVLYSLILPGMGEWYAGDFSRGRWNLVADGLLWIGYLGLNLVSGWIRDDGRLFAQEHAGIIPDGKEDQYFVDIGNFRNMYEYNQKKLRDRTLTALYDEGSGSTYFWEWDSDENRRIFRETRVTSDALSNGGRFVIIALIANRVWSAIRAAGMISAHNQEFVSRSDREPEFHAALLREAGEIDGVRFTFRFGF